MRKEKRPRDIIHVKVAVTWPAEWGRYGKCYANAFYLDKRGSVAVRQSVAKAVVSLGMQIMKGNPVLDKKQQLVLKHLFEYLKKLDGNRAASRRFEKTIAFQSNEQSVVKYSPSIYTNA